MHKTIRFAGDVHGLWYRLQAIMNDTPRDIPKIVQIGDLGVGFKSHSKHEVMLDELMVAERTEFIRGNHDSPSICKQMNSWIRDGTVEGDVMYIGGAWSIDYAHRIPGVSWWEDEELSYPQLAQMVERYELIKPRVMVTHDFPTTAARKMFFENPDHFVFGQDQRSTRTAEAFETMFDVHQPELWIGGHWHHDVDMIINSTRFICLDELSYCDVNMETLEIVKGTQ